MTVACICPNCGKSYTVAEEHVGRQVRCRQCQQTILIEPAAAATCGVLPSAAPSATPVGPDRESQGDRIGRFEIRRRLGAGAFGTVYHAYDPLLDRDVALKVPHPDRLEDEKDKARVLREAKAAARLHHPNIVPVYEAGADGQNFYIASALVEGQTLEAKVAPEPFDCRQASQVVIRLAEALDHAHRLGIIHRDVKPQNVMLDAQGEPMLMDFGLARLAESESQLTHEGAILGTPAYMSPEQARGKQEEVGPSSDQYSLGVVLYRLLCGQPPFTGGPAAVLFHVLNREPDAPRSVRGGIPRDLETICLKAMAKSAAERYSGCQDLAEDLRRWLADEPIQARQAGSFERLGRWGRRNPMLAILSATVLALLVLVAVVASLAAWKTKQALASAEAEQEQAELERQHAEEQTVLAGVQTKDAEQQAAIARDSAKRADEQTALADRQTAHAQEQEKIAREALARLQEGTETRKVAEKERRAETVKREAVAKDVSEKSAAILTVEKQAKRADESRQKSLQVSDWLAYTENLKSADQAYLEKQLEKMRAHLEACPERHRGWEWRYLKTLAGGKVATLTYPPDRAESLVGVSPNCEWIVTFLRPHGPDQKVSSEGIITLYRVPEIEPVRRFSSPGMYTYKGILSPTGKILAFPAGRVDQKGAVSTLWNVPENRLVPMPEEFSYILGKGVFSPDGKYLAIWCQNPRPPLKESLMLLVGLTGKPLKQLAQANKWHDCSPLVFAPNGELLMADASEGTLTRWRVQSKTPPLTIGLPRGTQSDQSLVLSRDGVLLAFAGHVLDARNGRVLATLPADVHPLAFSPDGQRLAVLGRQGARPRDSVFLWDIASQRELPVLEALLSPSRDREQNLSTVVFGPDWTWVVATESSGSRIRILNMPSSDEDAQPRPVGSRKKGSAGERGREQDRSGAKTEPEEEAGRDD